MGKSTTIDEIRGALERFGERATVITVSDEGRAHVATSLIGVDDTFLVAEVGARSRGHLEQRPGITLVWQPPSGDEYQLIVDGVASEIGEPDESGVSTIRITVESGIQHRLAGLPAARETCRAVSAV